MQESRDFSKCTTAPALDVAKAPETKWPQHEDLNHPKGATSSQSLRWVKAVPGGRGAGEGITKAERMCLGVGRGGDGGSLGPGVGVA